MSTLCRAGRIWQGNGNQGLCPSDSPANHFPALIPSAPLENNPKYRVKGGRKISDNRKYFGNFRKNSPFPKKFRVIFFGWSDRPGCCAVRLAPSFRANVCAAAFAQNGPKAACGCQFERRITAYYRMSTLITAFPGNEPQIDTDAHRTNQVEFKRMVFQSIRVYPGPSSPQLSGVARAV